MSNRTSESQPIIRITREEAHSEHVEDLLKRQASLRGDRGISRDRRGKWFYQSWFILMIAGGIAAFLGWAIIEPHFDDSHPIHGKIEYIGDAAPISLGPQGTITLEELYEVRLSGPHQETIYLPRSGALRIRPGGGTEPFETSTLKADDRLLVYVDYAPLAGGAGEIPVGVWLMPDPPPELTAGVTQSLEQQQRLQSAASLLIFPVIAALVGLAIGAADGLMCRLMRRVLIAGLIGMTVGFLGAFISGLLADLVYSLLSQATRGAGGSGGTLALLLHMTVRGLAWALAGMAMGLGQGIALRSTRLLLYGFIGGMVGGLVGGVLFDPIHQIIVGEDAISGHWSRLVGFTLTGMIVGLMIGIVELLARDAWLRMVEGPLAGKEFLIFKDVMRMGSSPRAELYLFNDPQVSAQHALIRAAGDAYEIENTCQEAPVCVNGRPVSRTRLRHGDRITLGRTAFVFQRQRGE
jgi:hypothetical protein